MPNPDPNPTPSKGLAFTGTVQITVGQHTARLTADGQRLALHADSLTTLNALREGLPALPKSAAAAPPDAITDLLDRSQVHFSAVVNDQTVFEISPEHTSSLLGKALGVPGKVHPLAALKSLLKKKSDS